MSITKRIVHRPTSILVITNLILGIGLYFVVGLGIPIDLYPDFTAPVIIVSTTYNGAGPRDVEESLTKVLEAQLISVSDLEKLTSTSSEGSSQITLSFKWGLDLNEATNEVRDKLGLVKDFLPEGADASVIFKFNPSIIPITYLGVSSERTPEELRKYVSDNVNSKIQQIAGVSTTSVIGGRTQTVRVDVDLNRLNAYNLTLSEVQQAIIAQNRQVGAGDVVEGRVKYLIRTTGEFSSVEDIKQSVISLQSFSSISSGNSNGNVIRLRDIATVYDGYKAQEKSTLAYLNGKPGVYIAVQKQTGTNTVAVAQAITKELVKINEELPDDIKLFAIVDTSLTIQATVKSAISSGWQGAILAMLILFLFLRNVKSTLIIGISIPLSVLVTMLAMYFLGLTLNIMSLTGIILGIGMIVDSSIVVLENIYRYLERGTKLLPATMLGTQEMIGAISSSTITTICVFLPILLLKNKLDFIGIIINDVAITVTIALLCSLIVAITIIPVLAGHVFKLKPTEKKVRYKNNKEVVPFLDKLEKKYGHAIEFALHHRKVTLTAAYSLFLLSFFGAFFVGFELLPKTQEQNLSVSIKMPPGTPYASTRSVVEQLEYYTREEVKGYESLLYSVGGDGFFGGVDTTTGEVLINLPPFEEQIDQADAIKAKLRKHFDEFPGAEISFGSGFGPPTGGSPTPIDILLRSDNLDKLISTSNALLEIIQTHVPRALDPKSDQNDGLPELQVRIDRQLAYNLGVNVSTVAVEVGANIDGVTASRYRVDGDEYDITVQLQKSDRKTIRDLDNIFVKNKFGQKIPLSSFATPIKSTGPVSIRRENQSRAIHITASLPPKVSVTEVVKEIEVAMATYLIADEDVIISFAGDYEDLITYAFLGIAIVLMSISLIFGVMASQFESFKDPFIIILSVPLTLIGIVFLYGVSGVPFSALTAIGFIVLSGIVVNNGIVLVDYTNLLRRRGYPLREACIEAGKNRLRPILMTTLTTILGMIPLALTRAQGSELTQAIGQTVVGGLTVSSFLTLFVVPVWYYIFNRKSEKREIREKEELKKSYRNS